MNRQVTIFIKDNYYVVTFFTNLDVTYTRRYQTSQGAFMDAKDWMTHGTEPIAQEELEELAI